MKHWQDEPTPMTDHFEGDAETVCSGMVVYSTVVRNLERRLRNAERLLRNSEESLSWLREVQEHLAAARQEGGE